MSFIRTTLTGSVFRGVGAGLLLGALAFAIHSVKVPKPEVSQAQQALAEYTQMKKACEELHGTLRVETRPFGRSVGNHVVCAVDQVLINLGETNWMEVPK